MFRPDYGGNLQNDNKNIFCTPHQNLAMSSAVLVFCILGEFGGFEGRLICQDGNVGPVLHPTFKY
jgi:hypothetical protein